MLVLIQTSIKLKQSQIRFPIIWNLFIPSNKSWKIIWTCKCCFYHVFWNLTVLIELLENKFTYFWICTEESVLIIFWFICTSCFIILFHYEIVEQAWFAGAHRSVAFKITNTDTLSSRIKFAVHASANSFIWFWSRSLNLCCIRIFFDKTCNF